ncbi:hypothetical protein [Pseudomonas sp. NPDC089569]|uniref:hypothetical protein n=1 Tax=Pseudomonas sp. NPDC089569 TaxID=3390722 RepID=UPI003D08E6E8
MKKIIDVVNDEVEANARPLRTVAVTNLPLGMAVGVLSVITAIAGADGHFGWAAGAFTTALALLWYGIRRTYKC